MNKEMRSRIKGYLEGFVQGLIDEHKKSSLDPKELRPIAESSSRGTIKPFHQALLPDGILVINEFERSFSTKLGTTFEECARLIGSSRFSISERGHRFNGEISAGSTREIERVINEVQSGGMKTPYPELISRVLKAADGDKASRKRILDLYLKDDTGNELFFEIKSPKPNKGQCLEATDRLLQVHSMADTPPPRLQTYYAMAYNPYGSNKSDYKHSFVVQYLDLDNQVLIGKEFWDLVGGNGAYEELLSIYQDVGREKGPDMIEQLALSY